MSDLRSDQKPAERIVAAACVVEGMVISMPPPNRHVEIIRRIYNMNRKLAAVAPSNQGFITSAARFVDRQEAYRIARVAGQVAGPAGSALYTEDLW